AWFWLPETVHRAHAGVGNPFRFLIPLLRRPRVGRMLVIDFVYWFAFSIFQTTFGLFTALRFGFDASRTGYVFSVFGVLGAIIQGGMIRPLARKHGDKTLFMAGLIFGAIGLVAAAWAPSVPLFIASLVPLALGIGFGHPTVTSLVSKSGGQDEQGRVQ